MSHLTLNPPMTSHYTKNGIYTPTRVHEASHSSPPGSASRLLHSYFRPLGSNLLAVRVPWTSQAESDLEPLFFERDFVLAIAST